MTQEIYLNDLKKFKINKAFLEKELGVKLSNRGRLVFIEGDAEKEYLALDVLEAMNLDFSVDDALELKKDNNLQIVNIKDITRRSDLERIRARIIGTRRRTLDTLEKLSGCKFCLKDNQVGIIGCAESIEDAIQALTSLIQGSKQGNVYSRLERQKKTKRVRNKLAIDESFG